MHRIAIKEKLKILHLEDLSTDAELVERELKKSDILYELLVVGNEIDFIRALSDFSPDIILSDHSLPTFNSFDALKIIREKEIKILHNLEHSGKERTGEMIRFLQNERARRKLVQPLVELY